VFSRDSHVTLMPPCSTGIMSSNPAHEIDFPVVLCCMFCPVMVEALEWSNPSYTESIWCYKRFTILGCSLLNHRINEDSLELNVDPVEKNYHHSIKKMVKLC
jgi:hypothetical protein